VVLIAVWLVLALLASWAPTARADETSPPSGGQLAVDTTSDPPPIPPGPADGTGSTGSGSSDPGTPPNAGDPNSGSPPTQPADPPPQETSPPVDGTTTPADTTSGTPGGTPVDTTTGGGSTTDTSGDAISSDPKKGSSSKASTDSPAASSGDQTGTSVPTSSQPTAFALSDNPGDEVWVDQWSAFTRADPVALLRESLRPGIRFTRGGSFVLFRTSKAKQLEAKARKQGETAKASPLGPSGVLHGVPGPGSGLFDLFAGNTGGGAVLTLFGVLGILAVTLMPLPGRTTAFRLPVVTWRPSEYVPPIEQPG
jgi:hypothetical protein